jgi:hypothetical protein
VEKVVQNFRYFCYLKKLPKVNYHPIGENSPNLVTLKESDCSNERLWRMKREQKGKKSDVKGTNFFEGAGRGDSMLNTNALYTALPFNFSLLFFFV